MRIRIVGALLAAGTFLLLAGGATASVDAELAFHRGVVAYGEGRFDDAKTDFERVLADDPEDTTAIHYLGLIAQAQKDPSTAIELYERALAIDPDDTDVRFDLGSAQLEAGRNTDAKETFDRVIADEPDRARAHLFAGIAAYRLGSYADAIPYLERAAELDEGVQVYARYYTGVSQALLGDLPTAQGTFAQVQEQSPLSPLGRSATSLREQLEPAAADRIWNLSIATGLEYDSNPTVVGSGFQATPRDDDGRAVYRIRGNVELYNDDRFSAFAGYDGYLSTHFDASQVDLQTHVGWLSGSVNLDPVQLGVRYDFAYTWIDLTTRFRRLNRITPTAVFREGDVGITQAYYQYQNQGFPNSVRTVSPLPPAKTVSRHSSPTLMSFVLVVALVLQGVVAVSFTS